MRYSFALLAILAFGGSANAFVPSQPAAFVGRQLQQQQQQQHSVVVPTKINPENNNNNNNKRCVKLYMGWGPEPVWSPSEVKTNDSANQSGSCVSVKVSVPPETAAEYKVGGQYVQFRLNEETKPLFLAIASPPDPENAQFEFLIKKTDDNGWITDAAPGTAVQISQVLGNGFPMEENLEGFKYDFPTQNILLFAAGSGISPIKAAMESGQLGIANAGTGGRTARLYYGVQNPSELCFVDKFPEWEAMGFQVVPVMSQPPDEWQGRIGYVQTCLEEDGVPIPRNSGALLCGMKGMAESVKDILTKAGVFEGRILTNF